jgi:hypothetical protein
LIDRGSEESRGARGASRWLRWLLITGFGGSGALALVLAVVRAGRPNVVFNFAEGMVAGSLAALRAGGLAALYPPEWGAAPLVLTLYPPGYFLTSGALAGTLGGNAILLAPRLVSLAATLAAGIVLYRLARRRGVDPAWLAVLVGAGLVHPGVHRQLAAAQTDMLALGWTIVGAWFVLGPPRRGTNVAALACFAMAAFAKQSFVAAPLALLIHRVLTGDARAAVRDYAMLAALAVPVVLLLQSVTGGGFLRHVLGAVAGSGSPASTARVLRDSRPELWVPLAALVGLAVRGRLRLEFPELWLALSTLLHGAATIRTGASVNYFLEPLTAVVVLGLVRAARPPWSPEDAKGAPSRVAAPPRLRRAPVAALLVLGFGVAASATSTAAGAHRHGRTSRSCRRRTTRQSPR